MRICRGCVLFSLALPVVCAQMPPAVDGDVRIRVLDPHGGRSVRIRCRSCAASGTVGDGRAWEIKDRKVGIHDLDGDALVVENLPRGTFALRIDTVGFARTLSEAFTIGNGEPTQVEIRVSKGGSIRGRVVGEDGKPLVGATVATIDDLEVGIGVFRTFGPMLPKLTTRTSTRTDAHGKFRLGLPATGDYLLRIGHEEQCSRILRGIHVAGQAQVDLGATALGRGAVVRGTASTWPDGVRCVVHVFRTDADGCSVCIAKAVADAAGRYETPQRVPPGRMRIVFAPERA